MKYNKLKSYISGFWNIKTELTDKSTHSITWKKKKKKNHSKTD